MYKSSLVQFWPRSVIDIQETYIVGIRDALSEN